MDGTSTAGGAGSAEPQGQEQKVDSSIGDRPGSTTWPIPVPGSNPTIPPVGLNWGVVAERTNADVRVLMHGGYILFAGDYVPETGYFLDADTLTARRLDVGTRVLAHGYHIGRLTADEFRLQLNTVDDGLTPVADGHVILRRVRAPVIGLFADRRDAERARDTILSGAIGSGVRLQDGPLGSELFVGSAEIPSRVATTIAAHAGAVISVNGQPLAATI